MELLLPQDFKEFLKLLKDKDIPYLLIGGYVVGYHGYPRATNDMDIWIAMDSETAGKMVSALKESVVILARPLIPEKLQQTTGF